MWPFSTIRRLREENDRLRGLCNSLEAEALGYATSLKDEQDAHNATLDVLDRRSKELASALRNEPRMGKDGKWVDKNGYRRVKGAGKVFVGFRENNSGVTMVEYGLIAALIAVVLVTILATVGENLNTVFGTISTAV